ncbi:MAG: fibronectin type III domain-containing protein [Verrucomicrobia bacterium]|nr:fibronectin type III domain-containing protein [Verrucomicrobiota bacterium]
MGNTMASGAGSLTLVGTATTGTSGAGHGIFIQGVGTGSNILSSTTGAISLSGTGTALSVSHGLNFTGTATAASSITTAAGAVTLNGTALSGGINHGITFTSNVNVSATTTGTVAVTGSTAGTGLGINLAPATGTTSGYTTAGGALTLTADTMNLAAGVGTETISTGSATAGTVTLKPLTAAVAVNLGSAVDTTASTLELSTAELDNVTAGTLAIGDAASGAITVSAVIAPLNFKTLALASNTSFSATGGFTADVTSASVFEKMTVTGTVNIVAGAALSMASAGGYIWNGTDTFTILDNDAADAITGTFTGPTLASFLGSALTATQGYAAGTGNDLVFSAPLSTNADLSALALTTATINEAFAAATTSYTANVPNATTSVTVTPTRAQANATLEARVAANAFASVTSGSPSASLPLAVGANTIQVRVTAQDGTTIKTYSIVVTRAAPAAPNAPTSVTGTAGNASASVAFTAPAFDGGSAILSYTVTSSPGGLTGTGAASPISVGGLTNGTAYTFTVTATNAIGTGAASAPSAAVTPRTVPGFPTSPVATPGNASASVAFTAPASNGGAAITGYTVTSSPGGFTGTGAASPINVTGLTNGTAYTFTVTATNVAGPGAASAASAAVTPSTVPGAPTSPVATAGNASASVAFVAPASNGGSAITNYSVTAAPGGVVNTGAGSPITLTGLTNGIAYTFTVRAFNANGPGAASVPSAAVTPVTVPNTPTSVVATPGNASASVAFSLFGTGGSAILSYTVTSSPGGFTGTGISSPISVTGLTNGTAYTFTVTATNAIGTSAASAPSAAVTPRTIPGAPTSPVATPGNASASVAFSAPASDGGSPITLYTVTSNPGSFTGTGAASPVTVSGLTNGTPYTFTVTATNVAGPGPASAASASVTPSVPAVMNNYVVTTILDSDPASWTALELSTGKINGGNTVSLRSAVLAANRSGVGPHTISVPADLGTYVLSQTNPTNAATFSTNGGIDLVVGSNGSAITIQGTGGKAIIQRGSGSGLGDVITTGLKADGFTPAIVNLTLDSLDITGGTFTAVFTGADDGLGNVSRTTITNSTLRNNTNADASFGQGGAIQNANGYLTISNTIFTSNTATNSSTGQGGAIYYSLPNASGQGSVGALSIIGCTFTSNTSGLASGVGGGAIYAQILSVGTNTTISGCTFTSNSATAGADGGAIVLDGTRAADITNNDFVTNSVAGTGSGGALYVNNGAVNLNYNRFAGNTAATAANGGTLRRSATATGTVNANDNWWQSNAGPATNAVVGTVTQTSRINLKLVASPITVAQNTASALTADFFTTSSAATLTLPQVSTLIGRAVSFGSAVLGTYSGSQATVQTAGTATSTFTSGLTPGAGSASVTIDGQTVSANITVTGPPPTTVVSLNRSGATPSSLASLSWQITFAQQVSGLTASNFALVNSGLGGSPAITGVSGAMGSLETVWNITASTGSGDGTLDLHMVNATALNLGVTNLPFIGQLYTIDKTAPVFSSLVRLTPTAQNTNADSLMFRATFSESVLNVDAADFTVSGTTATITGISGTGPYDITVSGGNLASLNGTVGLALAVGQNIADTAGNALPGTAPATNQTYIVDNAVPTVTITSTTGNPAPNAVIPVTVTFNESVTGFDLTDITVAGGSKTNFAGSGAVYTFDLTPSGPGVIVTADIAASAAQDAALNNSSAATQFTRTISPTLTASVALISSAATSITLNGAGFSTTPANNTVVLSSGTATVTSATATQLTCTVTGPLTLGALNGTVTVAGIGSTTTEQVATVANPPSIVSPAATNLGSRSVTLGANVTSDGGSAIIERGIVRSLTSANANPQIGGSGVTKVVSPGTTGAFTVNVSGLLPGTAHSYAGYATSAAGTTYTTPVSTFTTLLEPTISYAYGAPQVAIGGAASLTYTVINPNPTAALTGLAFTDALPAGLAIATPNGVVNNLGGTFTATAGTNTISLSGGTLAAGAPATLTVNVTGTSLGVKGGMLTLLTCAEAPLITTQGSVPPTVSNTGISTFTLRARNEQSLPWHVYHQRCPAL